MTKQTIVDALHELAQKCDDRYDTLIQDNAGEPVTIGGECLAIERAGQDGSELPIIDLAVSDDGIRRIRADGLIESGEPIYRVVDRGEYLRSQIYAWKPREHVRKLLDLLTEYNQYRDEYSQRTGSEIEVIDLNNVTSVDIPEDVTSWPVWVADNYGDALTGSAADQIEVLADVIETYRAQKAETIADAKAEEARITEQIRKESVE